jgi:hypothetical protein
MAIEVKEMVIKTTVDSNSNASSEKALCDDLKKIKNDILKESMENVIEYLKRQKEQ